MVVIISTGRTTNDLGLTARTAIRADMGSFFTLIGVFALLGLWPGQHRALLVSLAMVFLALVGRSVGIAAEGINSDVIEGLLVEVLSCAILIATYWLHHRRQLEKKLDAELAERENGQAEAEA